jgi:hypothetical protein
MLRDYGEADRKAVERVSVGTTRGRDVRTTQASANVNMNSAISLAGARDNRPAN